VDDALHFIAGSAMAVGIAFPAPITIETNLQGVIRND
jgi:hypothetical protein